ncbi:prenyltransferase/squalene oxidase repeat-containing protein [Streptomyces fumanus]|uniref:prenyltransferase/squalene oxidase repeat-containing protein n=1 Tax=Streptomyces fumanus TaxID=67302 RepID=UPI0033C0B19A
MNAPSVFPLHDLADLDASIARAVEGLFAYQGQNGAFAPSDTRYSPAHSALALIALHLTSPEDADGLITRGIAHLCRTQRFDGGWSPHRFGSEPLATALAVDALRLIAPERAASAIEAARILIDRIGHAQEHADAAPTGGYERLLFSPTAALRQDVAFRLPLSPGRARRQLSLQWPAVASLTLRSRRQESAGDPVGRVVRARTRASALSLIRQLYEHEGATGGFAADPMLTGYICIGLGLSGLGPDIARAAATWLRAAGGESGQWAQAPSHVRWTSLAGSALAAAGLASDIRLAATAHVLARAQHQADFAPLGVPAGGWSASGGPGWATTLDTAEAVSALAALALTDRTAEIREGVRWLTDQQDSAGSWSYAVRDTLPGAYGPCAHLTATAVRALIDAGTPADDKHVKKALHWLARRQDASGYFTAMWFRGHTIATAAVAETYCRVGDGEHAVAARARDWLLRTQRRDGSWSAGQSVGVSSVEETASALRALLATGLTVYAPPVARAVQWLIARQRTNGTWPGEPVNEHVRLQHRYADDLVATALALRALSAVRGG